MPFPIIDLFAGPGGLAEGFSSVTEQDNQRVFSIKLSIEKDVHAHQTLRLRSFVRQFPFRSLPKEYYDFVNGELTMDELFSRYPSEYNAAEKEAWRATLGETSENEIDDRIEANLNGESNWVLIGGPPCQAYSVVGRSRIGGVYEDDHRVYLYKEYLRIIARHQPAVFVMENVKGLLSAKVRGEKIFTKILRDLRRPSSVFPQFESRGYRIYSLVNENVRNDSDYLIKSENYGIPQKRHRVILLGVREDVEVRPGTLDPAVKNSLKSVIEDLPRIRSSVFREFSHSELVSKFYGVEKKRKYTNLTDSWELWYSRIEKYVTELAESFASHGHNVDVGHTYPDSPGKESVQPTGSLDIKHSLYDWFHDENLGIVLHHVSRSHLTHDLKRYMFASLYTQIFKTFPRMEDYRKFGDDLLPDHENAESGNFNDRFRVQIPDEPATTVTSHISKDGHYFIHYDPSQCRSFTVREAARVQTFPDNYYFCGGRTHQFHQVGNAVPPYLAYKIAEIVHEILVPERARLNKEPLLF